MIGPQTKFLSPKLNPKIADLWQAQRCFWRINGWMYNLEWSCNIYLTKKPKRYKKLGEYKKRFGLNFWEPSSITYWPCLIRALSLLEKHSPECLNHFSGIMKSRIQQVIVLWSYNLELLAHFESLVWFEKQRIWLRGT